MADFHKFPEERDRARAGQADVAELAREWQALDWSEAEAEAEGADPYDAVADDPAQWPVPPSFLAEAPRIGVEARGTRMRILRDPDGAERAEQQRLARRPLIHPEHVAMAVLWLAAVALGVWRWLG